ncbi:uncharacterized protein ARMOST_18816 [Armillaria ostoyae]|uniref:Uncharacterized protein n=1 Tax=Armillaria ostoyae TaxID=47428 RepID=A0A284S2S6_ARMOS|nr:uncharacterized protein ARMOST_18816 [Armillaria ostoyae]
MSNLHPLWDSGSSGRVLPSQSCALLANCLLLSTTTFYYHVGLICNPYLPHTLFQGVLVMDICPNCEFNAIRPYAPSVDAIDLLRSGSSSLDVSEVSVLNDIAHLEQELQAIRPLFIKIRDRYDKLVKDIGSRKSLLAPIRRLPRETLLQIFTLASSHNPTPFDAPWSLGHVCFTWRSLTRSSPSLWTNLHIPEPFTKGFTFLKEYVSLSHDLPVNLSLDERPDERVREILHELLIHSERWSSLKLEMSAGWLCGLLCYASFPAVNLTKLHISLVGPFKLSYDQTLLDILSVSPLKDVHFEHFPYSSMPINMTELRSFHVHSYDPTELHSIFRGAQRLKEFIITPSPPPYDFASDPSTKYVYTSHTSLQRLSIVMNMASSWQTCSKIPITFEHISLPALQQFEILTDGQHHDTMNLEPIEYLRLHDLFRRSQCRLTALTFSVPISVQSLLVPILAQFPTLRKLQIFINLTIARDVFKLLHREQGMVPNLKELCITEAPDTVARSCLLKEADRFYAMVLSRSVGNCDSHLETLRVSLDSSWARHLRMDSPVPPSSPFRKLLRIKEEGMNVELLLDRKDYLMDEKARATFFGD